MLIRAGVLGAVWLLVACGSGARGGSGDGAVDGKGGAAGAGADAGPGQTQDTGAADSPTEAPPPCNAVADDGPLVQGAKVAETLPSPAGGTFAAGTYHLTSQVYYSGPGGDLVPPGTCLHLTAVVVLGATPGEVDLQEAGKPCIGQEQRLDLHLVTTGTSVDVSRLCPGQFPVGTFGYTAAADSFMLFDLINGVVETYARQ